MTALDTPARFPRAGVGRSVAGRPVPCRVLPSSTAEPVYQSQAVSPQLVGQEQASLSRELAARGSRHEQAAPPTANAAAPVLATEHHDRQPNKDGK